MDKMTSPPMLKMLMFQERVQSEEEAERLLQEAKGTHKGYLGGRIIHPNPRQKWRLVQAYYLDAEGAVPAGLARLTVPADTDTLERFGINKDNIPEAA